jgi:predicted GIY-YIG superfamily endonuclease
MKGYVYILKCSDDSYYTGSTKDLVKRLNEHESGQGVQPYKKKTPLFSLSILKNLTELILHSAVKNKFKVGADKRKKL